MSCHIQLQYLIHGPLELNTHFGLVIKPQPLSLFLSLSLSIKRLSSLVLDLGASPPASLLPLFPALIPLSPQDLRAKALIQQAPPSGIQSCQFHVARRSSTGQESPSHHQRPTNLLRPLLSPLHSLSVSYILFLFFSYCFQPCSSP